jgi:hypothetical protein
VFGPGEPAAARLVLSGEQGDAGARGDRVDLEDELVDLVVERAGQFGAADEPEPETGFGLEPLDRLDGSVATSSTPRSGLWPGVREETRCRRCA